MLVGAVGRPFPAAPSRLIRRRRWRARSIRWLGLMVGVGRLEVAVDHLGSPLLRRIPRGPATFLARGTPAGRGHVDCLSAGSLHLLCPASPTDAQHSKQSSHQSWSCRYWRQGIVMALPSDASRLPSATALVVPAWRSLSLLGPQADRAYPAGPACSVSGNSQHHPYGGHSAGIRRPGTDRHIAAGRLSPSGLRAGTPDRRGKRGEVAAIFVMITTKPTGSIGELGLWTTFSILRPTISPATVRRRNSSSLGRPLGIRRMPPSLSRGAPSSATTGKAPSALAVATSNRSLPGPCPYSSSRAWTMCTLLIPSFAAVAATQSSRRRCASTSVNDVSLNTAASGRPGSPAPDPRSTHCSFGPGARRRARPRASSMWRSRRRSPSRGPRNPRSTAL